MMKCAYENNNLKGDYFGACRIKTINKISLVVTPVPVLLCVLGAEAASEDSKIQVVSTDPANGSKNLPASTSVSISFSTPINVSTLGAANFIVMNIHDSGLFDGEITYDNSTNTVTISKFTFRVGGQLGEGGGLHRGANLMVKLLNIEGMDGHKLEGTDAIPGSNYEFHFDVDPRGKNEMEDSPGLGLHISIIAIG
ncbi:MAG: Ig-like domain-containing protein [Candidatus Thermoplasmatota archaeon]|jgi:hypothetical protein|nr:Ig-like domain-containing protein [Candidatus Thermoplasmatota archaeon]MDP7264548.1 Ig-like domain-containing protein [Candidatus Thermoplasmatota archaeon]